MSGTSPLDVLVAGGGVAGLETMMALRSLAAGRVELALVAPPSSSRSAFRPRSPSGALSAMTAAIGAKNGSA